jgi:hypothetical protein
VVGLWPIVVGQYKTANDQGRTTNDQFNVGRQCDNRFRITVQESRLAPNIGLDDLGVARPEVGTIHTRLGGQPVKTGEDDI